MKQRHLETERLVIYQIDLFRREGQLSSYTVFGRGFILIWFQER